MLVPLNMFKHSSILFYWPFQGGASFVDRFSNNLVMFHFCLCYAVLSVPCSFVVTFFETADLLALLCVVFVTLQYMSWSTSEL